MATVNLNPLKDNQAIKKVRPYSNGQYEKNCEIQVAAKKWL